MSEAEYVRENNISYLTPDAAADDYRRERCRLDFYRPKNRPGFATVVWYHGGGMTSGEKEIPEQFMNQELAVIGVGYRLSPRAKCPAYLEDAAAAAAWAFAHVESCGGDPRKIFLSGGSAGAYLAAMLGLDKRWLAAHAIDSDRLAGLPLVSGQVITHLQIRAERGIDINQPVVDEYAPLYHVRKAAPPVFLVTGDRELEIAGRYDENAYFRRMLKLNGHPDVTHYEQQGFGHEHMPGAIPLAVKWIKARL